MRTSSGSTSPFSPSAALGGVVESRPVHLHPRAGARGAPARDSAGADITRAAAGPQLHRLRPVHWPLAVFGEHPGPLRCAVHHRRRRDRRPEHVAGHHDGDHAALATSPPPSPWGMLMDRIGRKPVVLLGSMYPLSWIIYSILTSGELHLHPARHRARPGAPELRDPRRLGPAHAHPHPAAEQDGIRGLVCGNNGSDVGRRGVFRRHPG